MKILNLYAGIGGNRKLWGDEHEITAVELDFDIAQIYMDFFPNDRMYIGDAHQYLLNHYKEFDFIWSSPPCPSHSRINTSATKMKGRGRKKLEFPDMKLYEEILFLQNWFDGKFCVENVVSYYKPLIIPQKIDRHYFWTNFNFGDYETNQDKKPHGERNVKYLQNWLGYDLFKYKSKNKRQLLRNCVYPETGLYILNCAMNIITKENVNQTEFKF